MTAVLAVPLLHKLGYAYHPSECRLCHYGDFGHANSHGYCIFSGVFSYSFLAEEIVGRWTPLGEHTALPQIP